MPSASDGTSSEILERFDRIVRDDPNAAADPPAARRASTLTAAELWAAAADQRARSDGARGRSRRLADRAATGNQPRAVLALWLACRASGVVDACRSTPAPRATRSPRWRAASAPCGRARTPPPPEHRRDAGALRTTADGLAHPVDASLVRRPCGDAAVLKLTSGSTGLPEGDVHDRGAARRRHRAHRRQRWASVPTDTQMAAIPLSHAYGLGNLLMPLLLQGTAIVLRESFVPHQFASDARAAARGVFHGVPFMFEHFVAHLAARRRGRARLPRLISAGARLEIDHRSRVPQPSASRSIRSTAPAKPAASPTTTASESRARPTVGRPLPGVTVDAAGRRTAHRQAAGASTSAAPRSRPATPAESRRPAFTDGGFLTGDYGRFDADAATGADRPRLVVHQRRRAEGAA